MMKTHIDETKQLMNHAKTTIIIRGHYEKTTPITVTVSFLSEYYYSGGTGPYDYNLRLWFRLRKDFYPGRI